MAPADAWYLFEKGIHADQLMVYAFAGSPPSVERAVEEVVGRARGCPELRLRVTHRRFGLGIPGWVPADIDAGQIRIHDLQSPEWSECLNAVARIIAEQQVDPWQALWRFHAFPDVKNVPASQGQSSTVVVLQFSHAFADGIRSAALAGFLFGRTAPLPAITPLPVGWSLSRVLEAVRWRRQLVRDTEAGLVAPPPSPVPALSINHQPVGTPILRTVVRPRSKLPEGSVTVGALVAISEALSGYLSERGEDASLLTALVPISKPGVPNARNHSGPEFIDLHPAVRARDERARLIATELQHCQQRRRHPALAADELALTALPGPLLRWGVPRLQRRSTTVVDDTVLGNTSVSSVNRGMADLHFGGCPVIMSCGYPFMTPAIGLTHGVHGIGDTVAISVNTTEAAMSDIDSYMDRLNASLRP
ncbi:MAG: DUF1298 domain-containing protein [Mycobacterium sp.]|nr:DUF1298 domain-containing protein [Mycobacterium sp.]